jgi:hypothetical protein
MHNKANQNSGHAEQLPGAPKYKGRYDVTGKIGNMVLVDSSFSQAEDFPRKFYSIWARACKRVSQACPMLNKFKEYRF